MAEWLLAEVGAKAVSLLIASIAAAAAARVVTRQKKCGCHPYNGDSRDR